MERGTHRELMRGVGASIIAVVLGGFAGCGLPVSGVEGEPGRTCATALQCDDGNPCTIDTCDGSGFCDSSNAPDGPPPEQIVGDCKTHSCSGGVASSTADAGDLPDDDNTCTDDSCAESTPVFTPLAPGTPCTVGIATGTCSDAAQCVVSCGPELPPCDDGEACSTDACDVEASECVFTPLDGEPVPGAPQPQGDCQVLLCVAGHQQNTPDDSDTPAETPSDCQQPTCVAGTPGLAPYEKDVPVDGNPCTDDVCVGAVGQNPPTAPGIPCGAMLVCDGMGVCTGCATGADCPGQDNDCQTRTCTLGVCGVVLQPPGTPAPSSEVAGDCATAVCDAFGMPYQTSNTNDSEPLATTCASVACGFALNNCNQPVSCPDTCTFPNTCGGGNAGANGCGCTPVGCPAQQLCGPASDGCGNTISCGNCGGTTNPNCNGTGCWCATAQAVCGTGELCTGSGCACGTIVSAFAPACGGAPAICVNSGQNCDCDGAAGLGPCGQFEGCDPATDRCACGADIAVGGNTQACPNADEYPLCVQGVGCACQAGTCGLAFVCGLSGECICNETADCGPGGACQADGKCKCGGNPACAKFGEICASGVCTCVGGACED